MGEEWHTAETMYHLNDDLHKAGIRDNAILFWNANNVFSFHRINWSRLNHAAVITTVSRYMKHILEGMDLNPLVIPNGIPISIFSETNEELADDLRSALPGDILLCKVARWDPDKRWIEVVEATAKLKDMGIKTILLARGGKEPYGQEVINRARSLGLRVGTAYCNETDYAGYTAALKSALPADVIDIQCQLPLDYLVVLYRAADAVLANSRHEPFGIAGLEAMAAGGIVFTGSTGEDYAIPFINSFMIETFDPLEIVSYIIYLKNYPQQVSRMRSLARHTARYYTWEAAVQNLIGKLENQGRIQGTLNSSLNIQNSEGMPGELAISQRVWNLPERIESEREIKDSRCLS
jgi:glycosyltransferase involved in cell wall biosynthesis